MIVNVKYFYEKTDTDYEEYDTIWDKNKERFVFLHTNFPLSKQISSIVHDITNHTDILAIRFPHESVLKNNKIINDILLGKGFMYDTNNSKIWYLKEVWIYNPLP